MTETAGRNKKSALKALYGTPGGFSLVELIVVLFILSIVALAAVPGLSRSGIFHSGEGKDRELFRLIRSLKLRAVNENRDLLLHLNTREGRAWVTCPSTQETDPEAGAEPEILLKGLPLKKVEVNGRQDSDGTSEVLEFYARGYSDQAVIVLGRGASEVSLKIEPFFFEPEMVKGEISPDGCP